MFIVLFFIYYIILYTTIRFYLFINLFTSNRRSIATIDRQWQWMEIFTKYTLDREGKRDLSQCDVRSCRLLSQVESNRVELLHFISRKCLFITFIIWFILFSISYIKGCYLSYEIYQMPLVLLFQKYRKKFCNTKFSQYEDKKEVSDFHLENIILQKSSNIEK